MINKQDYINSINQNIEMVRGDTLEFNFQIVGADSTPTFAFVFTNIINPPSNNHVLSCLILIYCG